MKFSKIFLAKLLEKKNSLIIEKFSGLYLLPQLKLLLILYYVPSKLLKLEFKPQNLEFSLLLLELDGTKLLLMKEIMVYSKV